jgi:limonene-1,2-epoxide hydrolase
MTATTIESRNEEAVRGCISAFESKDPAGVAAHLAPDVQLYNGPFDPQTSREEVQALLELFFPHVGSVQFRDLQLDAVGDMVFTERVECFGIPGGEGKEVKLPVCGIYRLNTDGKIAYWREYWDLDDWLAQGGPPFDQL